MYAPARMGEITGVANQHVLYFLKDPHILVKYIVTLTISYIVHT